MKKIILDTNFLLISGQFNIDIFSELRRICDFRYELYIIDKTINELEKIISTQSLKHKKYARIALDLIRIKNIKKIKTKEKNNVDELIIKKADKNTIVATQDIRLKSALKAKKIPIITLRQKKYLAII